MSIYIAHRRRKTSNALDTLVLSEQECFQLIRSLPSVNKIVLSKYSSSFIVYHLTMILMMWTRIYATHLVSYKFHCSQYKIFLKWFVYIYYLLIKHKPSSLVSNECYLHCITIKQKELNTFSLAGNGIENPTKHIVVYFKPKSTHLVQKSLKLSQLLAE